MKSAATPDAQMRALKDWAVERMTTGTQTPWAWFQYMKLLEVIDTFLEASDDAELHQARPAPRAKRARPTRPLPANVVSFDAVIRQRTAE